MAGTGVGGGEVAAPSSPAEAPATMADFFIDAAPRSTGLGLRLAMSSYERGEQSSPVAALFAKWRPAMGLCADAVCGSHLSHSNSGVHPGLTIAATTSSEGECSPVACTTRARA